MFVFNSPVESNRIDAYLEKMFRTYNGVVFQPFSNGLFKGIEYKVMFVGNQYKYFARCTDDPPDVCIAGDEKESEISMVEFAKVVMSQLPPIVFKGITATRLLTRIDVGCCHKGQYFVSEIEFVPSLFVPDIKSGSFQIDKQLGDQIIRISQELSNKAM